MPPELTVIAVTALLAGLLLVAVSLSGRSTPASRSLPLETSLNTGHSALGTAGSADGEGGADATLRVVWWLTITIVLLGVGISGSFLEVQSPIFALGAGAVLAVILFHEVTSTAYRGRLLRAAELLAATGLVAGLLGMSGYASSPFSILFALVAVAAALAHGPRAGLIAAALASVAFGLVLLMDPGLNVYSANDALRLSFGLGATWLLAFVAIVYADRQRRAVRRAVNLSRTDPLTGLFNRSQLYVTLEQEVSRTRRSDRGFCVLMIDLDGLKAINDTGGHLRGDQVLHAVGSVIAGSIRTVDSAYRYGGDEFVVVLPETDIVGAFVVAEKIRLGAEDLESTIQGAATPSVSIGLVSHPEDGLSAEELMLAADRAMYQAKSLGKNQISGNPRPRAALLGHRLAAAAPARESAQPAPPAATSPHAPATDATAEMRHADRAVAVPLGPVVEPEASAAEPEQDDAEPDPMDVRRNIATASRSFDPDDQVRRAMDAFFSPSPPPPAEERAAQEH